MFEGDDEWEKLDGDDAENGGDALIPKGREMTLKEEVSFLGWLFADSFGRGERSVFLGNEAG
jgi:hypothetical protein